jgi:hypothetical protein
MQTNGMRLSPVRPTWRNPLIQSLDRVLSRTHRLDPPLYAQLFFVRDRLRRQADGGTKPTADERRLRRRS